MVKRSYGQCKSQLAKVCGETGMSVTDPRVLERTNAAIQELIQEGAWPGVVDRWHLIFNAATGIVVLPWFLDRLIGVTVNGCPLEIRSPWYEFTAYGPGPQWNPGESGGSGSVDNNFPNGWIDVVVDRGEVVTKIPVPAADGPWKIRVYASVDEDTDEIAPTINLQGFLNKQAVRTLGDDGWYDGENVAIDFGVPYIESVAEFDSLSGIVKPLTHGTVTIKAWNGTTEVELSDFAYDEINPSYRCYFIPALWQADSDNMRDNVLLARARRRFFDVQEDNDELLIGNLPALKEMLIAVWKREAGNLDEYVAHKQTAVDLMAKEAMQYLGKTRTPSLSFSRGFPIGSLPFVH